MRDSRARRVSWSRTSTFAGRVGWTGVRSVEPASILDWRPSVPWLAVDGCRCDGSFVWTALVETRLPGLSTEDRAILSARIRSLRKTGKEAWVLTDDDTPGGALVLSDERPEHVS